MNKLYLFILLAITIILGKLVINNGEAHSLDEPNDFYVSPYIYAISTPTYVPTQVLSTKIDYYEILARYDWDVNSAYKILKCESSGNDKAHNFSHATKDNSHGLFQINTYGSLANVRPSRDWLIDPANNIEFAYQLYLQEGRRFGTTGGWYNCAKREGVW